MSEHAGVGEPGDPRDRVPGSVSTISRRGGRRGLRVREVAADAGWVCAGRHDAQRGAAQLLSLAQEGGNRPVALVLEWLGRHREQGVVGEQGHEIVDVAALDGIGEASDQSALAGGVRLRRAFAVGGWTPFSQRRPGALQGALR